MCESGTGFRRHANAEGVLRCGRLAFKADDPPRTSVPSSMRRVVVRTVSQAFGLGRGDDPRPEGRGRDDRVGHRACGGSMPPRIWSPAPRMRHALLRQSVCRRRARSRRICGPRISGGCSARLRDFGRSQPLAFVGGAIVGGFLIARSVRSGRLTSALARGARRPRLAA